MNYYLVAVLTLVGYFLYKYYIYPLYLSPLCKIPGPPIENFILGNSTSILSDNQGEVYVNLKKQYGGMVRYHLLLNEPNILISDPKLVQQILVTRSYDYPKHFPNKVSAKQLLGEGIFFAHGDVHKRQRKMMNPSFAIANVKEMMPTFVQGANQLKDLWTNQIGNKKEERITITNLVQKITLDIIGLVGFNYEFNSTTTDSELSRAYNSVFASSSSFIFLGLVEYFPFLRKISTPQNNKYWNSINTIYNAADNLIAEQKNSLIRGKDLLSLLVKSNENLPADEQLTHNELRSQVMTLLLAGHETTSTVLSWTLYYLAKNPDVQDQLRKEILNVFISPNHIPSFEELDQLKFLECVFKEALRITPPSPLITRYNLKDEIMNGYVIPKNTPLIIPSYAIHHDPLIWGEDVESFNPSRWLDPNIKSKISNSNFIPFSAGPRSCLGMRMAHLELKTFLTIIIRNLKFGLVDDFTFKKRTIGLCKPVPGMDLLVSKVDL
ncbi:cytochrome P450 [Gigaspora rosea]|uniref:Cytochrome P450 n=1 Tax=Gigaspora rosea TaxID=44941 RepID=A0A397VH45_9GLOM|nr:cytochrome P450 [Gigaspora rosea]